MARKKAGLSRDKNGKVVIGSEDGVAQALRRREQLDDLIQKATALLEQTKTYQSRAAMQEEDAELEAAIREFVLNSYEAGSGYEDDRVRLTKVQGHTRTWNVDKLQAKLSRGLFKSVTQITVVPAKIDEMVRKGKIDLDAIADAYEERANKPYVKPTAKKDGLDAEAEADNLAELLA
jgi:hypothetical protein